MPVLGQGIQPFISSTGGIIYSLYSLFKPINNMSYIVIYWQRLPKIDFISLFYSLFTLLSDRSSIFLYFKLAATPLEASSGIKMFFFILNI